MDAPLVMGQVIGPYGVKGWVRVRSYTELAGELLDYSPWYLRESGTWRTTEVLEAKPHGKGLVVHFPGCQDRDQAERLTGIDIGLYRSQLPATGKEEYYWCDLLGLRVVTLDGISLGIVDHLIETGSNDVLVLRGERERLVPFIMGQVIAGVDLDAGEIRVDWDPDF